MSGSDPVAKIHRAGGCAIFCGVVTWIMMAIFSEAYDEMFGTEDVGMLKYIDVFLIFGLTVGIFMKSRIAAWSMFLYFTLSKLWMWHETGAFQGIGVSLVFMYFFFQGAIGTTEYHRDRKAAPVARDEPPSFSPFQRGPDPTPAGRSLVARTRINEGTRIREDMLEIQRTGGGLEPGEWDRVIGSVAKREIREGDLLRDDHLTTA